VGLFGFGCVVISLYIVDLDEVGSGLIDFRNAGEMPVGKGRRNGLF
jgi:hypothetical protein